MRLTYVKEDKIVGIDGVFVTIDNSNFDQEVSAIQWYDTFGEIEFEDKQSRVNEKFEDINYINELIHLYNLSKKESENIEIVNENENSLIDQLSFENINFTQKLENKNLYYVYIHIPKTAGTFIKSLISNSPNSNIFDPFIDVTKLSIPIKNAPTVDMVKEFLPSTLNSKVKYFIVVRNPYDRVYSMWKWSRINGKLGSPDFPEVSNNFIEFIETFAKGGYDQYHFFQSQSNYIDGEDKNNIKLFKFENMESIKSFLVENNVNWKDEKINSILAPNYKTMYNLASINYIKEKCANEFDIFEYSTEL